MTWKPNAATVEAIERERAIEEIIIREFGKASDPTWPVAAAREIGKYLSPTPQYYWFNEVNYVEWGGPFASVEEAKQAAIKTYKFVGDMASSILILQVVKEGKITTSFVWEPS